MAFWTGKRWAYLAVVLDLFARKPVGWAMSFSPDSRLTMKALEMAWETRGKPVGVMFHSDQGSHYTSRQFRQLLWSEFGMGSGGTTALRPPGKFCFINTSRYDLSI